MNILVLDDHDAFRNEIVNILQRNHHAADGVATAEAAIPRAEEGQYDIVLVDYHMPEHDGIWFMKNVNLPRHTKALLVTAHVQRQIINKMFKYGVSGYIIKPFDEATLLKHLDFHTESSPP